MSWADAKLIGRPVGANDENSNRGGFVIELSPGSGSYANPEEIARVAFDRTEGSDPDSSFNDKLDEAVSVARKCVDTLRELFAHAGELQ